MRSRKPKSRSIKDSAGVPRTIKRSVSVPLLVSTAIVLALGAVGSYAWRNYQVQRLAPDLLRQAEALEAQGKLAESTQRIFQYLQIVPDDTEAKITLAEKYDAAAEDLSRKIRAIDLYAEALRDASPAKQTELQRRMGVLLLEVAQVQLQAIDTDVEGQKAAVIARLSAAAEAADAVLAQSPRDPEASRIVAWSLLGRHELDSPPPLPAGLSSIAAAFEQAVALNPADAALAIRLARLYRTEPHLLHENQRALSEAERARRADAVVDRMVQNQQANPETLLARFSYRRAFNVPGENDDLAAALELAPDNVAVQLSCGLAAQTLAAAQIEAGDLVAARDQREIARRHYEQSIELAPKDVRPYLLLTQLLREQGEIEQAIAVVRKGLVEIDQDNLQLNALAAESLLAHRDDDPQRFEQIATHLETFRRGVERIRPLVGVGTRRALERNAALLHARLLVQQERFDQAIPLLNEQLLDLTALSVAERTTVWQLLETCHRRQQQWDQAARATEELIVLDPKAVKPRARAAVQRLAAGNAAAAVQQLTRALAVQDSTDLRLLLAAAQLEYQRDLPATQRDWTPFTANLAALKTRHAAQPIPDAWRLRLLEAEYEAARAATALDPDPAQAVQLLRRTEVDYPDSLGLFRQLAALYQRLDADADAERATIKLNVVAAMQAGNWAELEPWLDKLHARADDPLTLWQYYSGRQLIARATSAADPALDAAADLAAQVEKAHPDTRHGHVLRGLARDRQKNFPDAVEAYRSALARGEPSEFAYQRLVLLLAQLERFDEADAALAEFRQRLPDSPILPSLAILIQDRQGNRDGAILLAEQEVEANRSDPQARVRLGRLLEQKDQLDDAERAYQHALVLDAAHGPALVALINLYSRTERQAEAKALLDKLASNPQLDPVQRVLVRADGLEILDDRSAAQAVFDDAVQADPKDPRLQIALAQFHARGRTPESLADAEQLVRDLLQRAPEALDAAEAQRTLADILLLKSGSQNRQQALAIIESLARDAQQLGQADALALARLRQSQGDWQGATRALELAAAAPDATPAQLRLYIDRLLIEGDTVEAGQRITQLERIEPGDPATLQLKVRWLSDAGRADEIPPVLEAFATQLRARAGDDPQRQSQADLTLGALYASVDRYDQAEPHFRRLLQREPRAYDRLAQLLARQGRLEEAIQLCFAAAAAEADEGKPTVRPALVLRAALLVGKPTPSQAEKADELFHRTQETLVEDPAFPDFLSALATLRLVQKRTPEAIELYRTLLDNENQARNHSAWNNLAVALGEDPQTADQALAAIDKAIELGGQRPAYLDTKATILLLQNQHQQAVELLEKAVAGPDRNAVHQLHLAVAYDRIGRGEDARKTYHAALENNIRNGHLTESDLAQLGDLEKKFR